MMVVVVVVTMVSNNDGSCVHGGFGDDQDTCSC